MRDEDMRFLESDREAVAAYGLPKRQEELLLALMAEERRGVKNCDVVIRKFGNEYMERVGIYDVMNCARYGRALPISDFVGVRQHESEKMGVNANDTSLAVQFDDIYAVTRPSGRCVYVNHDAGQEAEETHSVPAAEPEERVADLDAFRRRFTETYNDLYNHRDAVVGYREAVAAGDDMLKSRPEFVQDFGSYRMDPLTSDRDMAAFAFTMQSTGLIKGLKDYEKDFSKARWSMGHDEIVERMHKTIEARNASFQKADTEHKKKHRGRGM